MRKIYERKRGEDPVRAYGLTLVSSRSVTTTRPGEDDERRRANDEVDQRKKAITWVVRPVPPLRERRKTRYRSEMFVHHVCRRRRRRGG